MMRGQQNVKINLIMFWKLRVYTGTSELDSQTTAFDALFLLNIF